MRTDTPPTIHRLADYRPTDYAIETVDLMFRLHPTATHVRSVLTVRRREGVPADAPLVLDGDELHLVSIALDGTPLDPSRYEATPECLTVRDLPDAFGLMIETEVNPTANTQLMGLYRSSGTYCTQCEAEGFRRITYMLDRPDVLATYTTRIEAPDGEPVLLGNGDLVEDGALEGGGRYAVWRDPHPKPCYLFALVAGDLGHIEDRFTTMGGREVRCRIYVEHGKESRATWAMDSLLRSMKWDEERWGREYDLDVFNIVAVSDFNMGAMENKGLNVFNDKLVLASPETATDTDYARIEAVVAHEYFHNWTGNRITCRDWFQLCLKEGLTVYRDHEFQADMRDRDVRRIDEVRLLRAAQFPEDQGPLRHPVRPEQYAAIDNFYTATVYEKGSELVRMIATLLGREAFRAGMDLYFERHDGEACTIEQFIICFEEAGKTDLAQFMRWYTQPGTPTLSVGVSRKDGDLIVDFEQSQPPAPDGTAAEPLVIPIALELIGARPSEGVPLGTWNAVEGASVEYPDGEPLAVMTERTARLVVQGAGGEETVIPSFLAGFSAPVVVRRDDGSLIASLNGPIVLAGGSRDPFTRWDALNVGFRDLLVREVRGEPEPENHPDAPSIEEGLVWAFGRTLRDEALSPAFRATAATLPSDGDVAQALGTNVDPDTVHAAREELVRKIATEHRAIWERLYDEAVTADPYRPDAEQSGRRALRNITLDTLAVIEGPARAAEQFANAANMTQRFAALATLVHRHGGSDEARTALDDFAQQYGGNALVMDKWLGVQAATPGADTLSRVIELETHPAFDGGNPNRVRALWGVFAMRNPTGFHHRDGASYRAFAERLLAIDRNNPQLSSRLATAFGTHQRLEPVRQEAARNALEGLSKASGLSPELADIVVRTLAK